MKAHIYKASKHQFSILIWRLLYRRGWCSRRCNGIYPTRAVFASSESAELDWTWDILRWTESVDVTLSIPYSCIRLRYLNFSCEYPLAACRELRNIMAGLIDNLQMQTLWFMVKYFFYETPFDGGFLEGPFPHLYDAMRLLLERCPQLQHLYVYPAVSRTFLMTNSREHCCDTIHGSLLLVTILIYNLCSDGTNQRGSKTCASSRSADWSMDFYRYCNICASICKTCDSIALQSKEQSGK